MICPRRFILGALFWLINKKYIYTYNNCILKQMKSYINNIILYFKVIILFNLNFIIMI